jgi:hypothetical protein
MKVTLSPVIICQMMIFRTRARLLLVLYLLLVVLYFSDRIRCIQINTWPDLIRVL